MVVVGVGASLLSVLHGRGGVVIVRCLVCGCGWGRFGEWGGTPAAAALLALRALLRASGRGVGVSQMVRADAKCWMENCAISRWCHRAWLGVLRAARGG